MTDTTRTIRRLTFSSVRERGKNRPIVIELHSTYLRVRAFKSTRYFTVEYGQLYDLGAKNAAAAHRREVMEKRKARAKQ
jgi:hypothetical protein